MTDTPMLPFDDPILAEFRVFDAANPHVWEHFERFTLKANNNWTRCYSRKWAETHPEHAEFFERRAVRAKAVAW